MCTKARLPTHDRKDEVWKQTNAARRVLCRFVRVMWTMFASLLAIFLRLGVSSEKGPTLLPGCQTRAAPRRAAFTTLSSNHRYSIVTRARKDQSAPHLRRRPRRALDHGIRAGPRSASGTYVPSAGCLRPCRGGYTGRGFQLDLAASKTLASSCMPQKSGKRLSARRLAPIVAGSVQTRKPCSHVRRGRQRLRQHSQLQ